MNMRPYSIHVLFKCYRPNLHCVSKTSQSFIGHSMVKHCPILIMLGKIFLRYIGMKRWFHFPPYLILVPTLHGEILKNVNLTIFVLYVRRNQTTSD